MSISDYIQHYDGEVRQRLEAVRRTIESALPESAEQALSYGMPTYKLHNKNVIHFAANKQHIGIYPSPQGVTYFTTKYPGYATSKGAIQFQHTEPLPLDALKDLTVFRASSVRDDTFPMK